jgi:hypothetical protein
MSAIDPKNEKEKLASKRQNIPRRTSLNWANRAPGRAPAACLEAMIRRGWRVLGEGRRKEDKTVEELRYIKVSRPEIR